MRICLFHTNKAKDEREWHLLRAEQWTNIGYSTEVVELPDNLPKYYYPKLKNLWRKRDPKLLKFYQYLLDKINRADIFIHFGGAMIVPEFLERISPNILKVYHCADDPESSKILSKPVAIYYDVCAISNIAELGLYRSWGVQNVFFWPMGSQRFQKQYEFEIDNVNYKDRSIQLGFIGGKYGTPKYGRIGKILGLYNKKNGMQKVIQSFPNIVGYGSGWKNGYIESKDIPQFYSQLRIGINMHNSTGPINFRLFDLCAFGVCQVCDNKSFLGKVFKLDEEIIGYSSFDEAIEKIRYLIDNPSDAQKIARAGRERFMKDYQNENIILILIKNINEARNRIYKSYN